MTNTCGKNTPPRSCKQCGKMMYPREYKTKSRSYWLMNRVFCSQKCSSDFVGEKRSGTGSGWRVDSNGYLMNTHRNSKDYLRHQHRVVMEQILGRKLRPGETIHHKNGIRTDNRPENLELWADNHGRGQRVDDQDIWSGTIPSYQINCGI